MQASDKKPKKPVRENAALAPVFSVENLTAPAARVSWKLMLPVWAVLLGLIALGFHYHWKPRIVGGSVVLLAILSNAFSWLVATVGLTPIIGPFLIKILALPVIWLLNAIGYIISYVAVRRGHSRDVLASRGLTIALVIGVVIGYIIGKLV